MDLRRPPLFLSQSVGLGIRQPLRREQVIQNPRGGLLDRRQRVGEGLLIAMVERNVIGCRVLGLKANALAHHKGDRLRLGFPNDLWQRRRRFIVVHHLVSEFMRQNRKFLRGRHVRHKADMTTGGNSLRRGNRWIVLHHDALLGNESPELSHVVLRITSGLGELR